jgi:ubiquinone/menaquinone biosynthesis C-methylase UbiE
MPSTRVNYDAIAGFYDRSPHREKSPDPELGAFLAGHESAENLILLDIACGTGNQLIANRTLAPHARLIGIDGSLGMLRQAQRKAADIAWVHGDSAALPFATGSFDFVSCQYAFHHFRDKAKMVHEAFRVLRRGGRFVLYNLSPHDMPDFIYYAYFPETWDRDLADFWSPEQITAEFRAAGFEPVAPKREHRRFEHDLRDFLETTRRRENNSQLLTLSDAAYETGLRLIERDIAIAHGSSTYADHLCFLTVQGSKPANIA